MPIAHSHDAFEATLYGVEGITTLVLGGARIELGAGDTVLIPRGAVHSFAAEDGDASFLAIATPGLFGPEYFHELKAVLDAAENGPPDPQAIMAVMPRHGLTPAPPARPERSSRTVGTWTQGIKGRHGRALAIAVLGLTLLLTALAAPRARADVRGYSAGGSVSCAVLAEGVPRCWGSSTQTAGTPTGPTGPGSFSGLTSGLNHTCAIDNLRHEVCWGSVQNDGPPQPPTMFSKLSAGSGGSETCGIKSSDSMLVCWGPTPNATSAITTNVPAGAFTDVSVGQAEACGILTSTSVIECWGNGSSLGSSVTASKVSVGADDNICYLAGPTATCLGSTGTAVPGFPISNAVDVAASANGGCAVTTSAAVACSDSSLRSPPNGVNGQAVTISVGGDHSGEHACAQLNDHDISCWGTNQSNDLGIAASVPQVPPGAEVNKPYSFQFALTGTPTEPVSVTGSLPAGLAYDQSTRTISGTPTTTGTSTFTAAVDNGISPASSVSVQMAVGTQAAVTGQPQSTTVNAGQNATFSVTATGTPSVAVQWQSEAPGATTFTNVSGATMSTLTLSAVAQAKSGTKVQAIVNTGVDGPVTSNPATLTVVTPAQITTQPVSTSTTAGHGASFSIAVSGTPTPSVQWQRERPGTTSWVDESGATGPTLSFASTAQSDDGTKFRAHVTQNATTLSSDEATLTVVTPAQITAQPVSATATAGQGASFSIGVSGTPTPSVQWQRERPGTTSWVDESGATGPTLSFASTAQSDDGTKFRAHVTQNATTLTSDEATLTVETPPSIATQPQDVTAPAGDDATFTVAVDGSPAPDVQWSVGSSPDDLTAVEGATGTTFTLTAVTQAQSGLQVEATVTNHAGFVDSRVATLTVQTPPSLTTQPADQTVHEGQDAAFSVAVAGDPAPTVQWQAEAPDAAAFTDVPGATNPTLTLSAVTRAQDGTQVEVVVTNAAGSVTSEPATLTVQTPPSIVDQPADTSAVAGTDATFVVTVAGLPAPTIQWQRRAPGAGAFTDVPGATGAKLVLSAVSQADGGTQVKAVVENALGSVTSSAAKLTVTAAPSGPTGPTGPTSTGTSSPGGATPVGTTPVGTPPSGPTGPTSTGTPSPPATTPVGTAPNGPLGPFAPAADTTAPQLSGLSLARKAKKGKKVTLEVTTSEGATLRVVVARQVKGVRQGSGCKAGKPHGKRKPCTRTVTVKTVTTQLPAGAGSVVLPTSGLPVGKLTVQLKATDAAGNTTTLPGRRLRITKR